MRIKKVIGSLLIFICVIVYGYSSIDANRSKNLSINIDMGTPLEIVWPCEISIVGEGGEKGLRIGPKIGRGWRGEAGGKATYKFYIPEDGKYHIWAYCLWFDECTNATFAQIDGMDRAIVGNDPVYNKWHWVRGFDANLNKGTRTLVLSNHSDHISIQKVLLTNSTSVRPEDCGLVFSDIFYDGFDGCDQGNFGDWKIISGDWKVEHRSDKKNPLENVLVGTSQTDAFIIYDRSNWSDYAVRLMIKANSMAAPQINANIYFGMSDLKKYYKIVFKIAKDSEKAVISAYLKDNEGTNLIGNNIINWQHGQWQQIDIYRLKNSLIVKFNDKEYLDFPATLHLSGGIGLQIEGKAEMHFDDIHIQQKGG